MATTARGGDQACGGARRGMATPDDGGTDPRRPTTAWPRVAPRAASAWKRPSPASPLHWTAATATPERAPPDPVTGSGGCPAPSRDDPVHAHSFSWRRPPLPTGGGCGSATSSPTHRLWIWSAAASPIPPTADPVRCGLLYPTGSGSVISGQESHGGLQSASVPLSLRCCVELPPLPSSLTRWRRTAAAGQESHRPPAGASDLPRSR
jgi:hypothetical protein